jgi:hypothetical protein
MTLSKLSKYVKKNLNVCILIAFFLLVVGAYFYSSNKGLSLEKHTPLNPAPSLNPLSSAPEADDSSNQNYQSVTDVTSDNIPTGNLPSIDPSSLLPKDENSEWNKLNPTSSSNVGGVNMLTPSPQNFLSANQPLRNPNLQLRSDPPVPQVPVSPWNNTTIGPDESRLPLNIGCKA